MRHAARAGAGGQNLDSLLDTMANVVGILVVLVAVTQLTVNDAMKRIRAWESEEAVALRKERRAAEAALALDAGEDLARTLELARLREHLERTRNLPRADPATVSADVAQRRMQIRRLEAAIAEKQEKLANLQVLLQESEVRAEQPGIALRLPDPRPAPPRAEPLVLLARHGRIFDPRFEQLSRELQEVMRTVPGPVERYFDRYDVGNELLRWRVVQTAAGRVFRLDWRSPDIGETPEELGSPRSALRERLDAIDPRARFLHFYVWGDSFEVYLEARRMAEEAGFSAGWIPLPANKPLELVVGSTPPTPVD